ncbi:MAG: DUF4982 domain-containing protein [Bacteroidales bacterium]|nr:DUF4982 domain-containing protein [Bacteroidales bacterium]
MKRPYLLLLSLFCIVFSSHSREKISFNEDWLFYQPDSTEINPTLNYESFKEWILPTGNTFYKNNNKPVRPATNLSGGIFADPEYDDQSWRKINLPHDWGIEGPFVQEYPGETAKLPWFGVAWYRKHFEVDPSDPNQQFYLQIDGAMSFSTVWCNGQFVGGWPYGYASYEVDLTPYIQPGKKNVIAIRLDNPQESSRWYPGGGIYRNIWLIKTHPIHVAQWGSFITTQTKENHSAAIELTTNIINKTNKKSPVEIKTEIFEQDKNGKIKKKVLVSNQITTHLNNSQNTVRQSILLPKAKLWNIETPHLYVAKTTISESGKIIDSYFTPFGIRTIEFTANNGFLLNGQRVVLQGVCMHHDLGALGAAFNYRAQERQLEILKEMGVNAIRTAHNPPAPEMLDLCDKMGFLVIDEFVDTWSVPKKRNGYALLFEDWHEQDLRALIHRDRNHPSVIAWSTGNEVGEQGNQRGIEISQRLTHIIHQEDPTRPSTIGCDNPNAGFNGFEKTTDIFGFNYKPHLYVKFHQEKSNIPFYGSETASCISTRGEYLFPVDNDKSGGKIGFQMSSYDLYAPSWACPPDTEFRGQDEAPASAGEFVWTGFDYLGEPTPFTRDMTVLTNYHDPKERAEAQKALEEMGKIKVPSRSSYFGIVDLAGFKKDRFYIYQARWRPELPMAHILPHWNWPERIGLITPIHIYTSGDSAELFLNGKSLGKKTKGKYEYRLRWDDVIYEPGEVKVIAYKNGKKWAEDRVVTTQKPSKIYLEVDRKEMKADGYDLIHITAKIQDPDGLTVPRANNLVYFQVDGPAEIIATDNGDPTSHESFQNKHIKAFNGLGLVILRSKKGETGKITLEATSENLLKSTIELKSTK